MTLQDFLDNFAHLPLITELVIKQHGDDDKDEPNSYETVANLELETVEGKTVIALSGY